MSDKLTPNRSTLLRFVATDMYLNKKLVFIVQLLYLTGAKCDLAARFVKGHFTT